jgi:hypothetical protein
MTVAMVLMVEIPREFYGVSGHFFKKEEEVEADRELLRLTRKEGQLNDPAGPFTVE